MGVEDTTEISAGGIEGVNLTYSIEPVMPCIQIEIDGQSMRFRPQRDITAYELGLCVEMFTCAIAPSGMMLLDVEGWWRDVGPAVWRHWEPVR